MKYRTPKHRADKNTPTAATKQGQTIRSNRGARLRHGETLRRCSGGTITLQSMKDRLPNSATNSQSLAIAFERIQGTGTTIKSFSSGLVHSGQKTLTILKIEQTDEIPTGRPSMLLLLN